MDPLATLAIVNDKTEDGDTRSAHLHYLAEWIARGGAFPIGAGHVREDEWDESDYDLAAAVNVAIINSDLSGLVGLGYIVQI